MIEQFDDDPDAEFPATGVPPAPSVTPGPNPPPPPTVPADSAESRGCLVVLMVGAALAVVALVLAIILVVIGLRVFGRSDDSANDRILKEVFVETGIASASRDAVHPPQRDIHLGACESDGADGVRASGTLTNWTNASADYQIDISFRSSGPGSSGEEFAASTVSLQAVPEHATTNWQAVVPRPREGAYACRVVAINRWATGTAPPS